jgi:chromosomal replication initiator protein
MPNDQMTKNDTTLINDYNAEISENKNLEENKEKYSIIWQNSLEFLSKKIKKITFDTWINKLELIELKIDLAVIAVKNEFTKNFIQQSYIKDIQQALLESTGKSYGIRLEIINKSSEDFIELPELKQIPVTITEQKSIASVNEHNTQPSNKSKLNNKINLIRTYLGAFNKTCYTFAKSIIEDRSNTYNSLFIHSQSGLGKSHFLNLIGNETKETNPNLSIKYVSSESFINELIMSIQKNRTFSFREKYRDLDVLLFDDFQFLENKKTCQEEFIHTYESISKRGGKIIIAANKNINELKNLNPKLSSIIKSGLVTTIEEPSEEDKNKLIDFKIKELKINLKDEHKRLIYKLDGDCIRELEGNLLQISALQKFSGLNTDDEAFTKVFECNFATNSRGLSVDKIIETVAKYFYIDTKDLVGKKRNEEFTKARHLAIYLIFNLLGLSYKKIGSYFSDRKHSSIIHSIKTIESALNTQLPSSKFTQTAIQDIKSELAKY